MRTGHTLNKDTRGSTPGAARNKLEKSRLLRAVETVQQAPERLYGGVVRIVAAAKLAMTLHVLHVQAARERAADELLQLAVVKHAQPGGQDEVSEAPKERSRKWRNFPV